MSARTKWFMNLNPKIKTTAKNFTIPLSFFLPIITLYLLNPNSFQIAWTGRAPYLFFIWLFSLELVLAWGKLPKNTFDAMKQKKILATLATLTIPTFYIICTNVFGLNQEIMKVGKILGVWPYEKWFLEYSWPLSLEYLVFTSFFVASIWLIYGTSGLKRFQVSLFLLGSTGLFHMINTFYPYGTLKALQGLLPLTTSSASQVLRWMGYQTQIMPSHHLIVANPPILLDKPILYVIKGDSIFSAAIFWPCAGINGLIIYSIAILLFLRDVPLSLQPKTILAAIPKKLKAIAKSKTISFFLEQKIILTSMTVAEKLVVSLFRRVPIFVIFIVGAAGTYIINIFRIVSICIIGVTNGEAAAQMFHSYYGELYFIAWMTAYPLAIIYGPKIVRKLCTRR